jgi:UDP-glucuronate 4-epimerase
MMRDFTFIDDVVEGVVRIHNQVPSNSVPYHLYNIGNSSPIELSRFITAVENACGSVAKKIFLDMQPGDVTQTFANISALEKAVGYKPAVEIEEGITHFVAWYKKYRKLSK